MQRRAFLQSSGRGVVGACIILTSASTGFRKFAELRANILDMVNEERAVAKVPPVAVDELATRVATIHATEMALHEFASHWGRNGFKPYHRYSFAGGTEATQENVSAADNTWSNKLSDLKQDTSYLHLRLYRETPPNDGHRKTILAPQHTHVGFGIAVDKLRLRLVELFVARYLEVKAVPREAKPKNRVVFAAKMLKRDHTLNHVEVFYELLPVQPELSWLREPRSDGLPDHLKALRPKVAPPYMYSDRTGVTLMSIRMEVSACRSRFFTTSPESTRSLHGSNPDQGKAFPATEVCIQALDR